ncbi:conserved hypothetical protein [Leishmania infantum JPCM5]|uniref:Uncharacterized protein n=2 Tax=Leishmania infantum TaxID=5671 RepID=A4I247_LEIIN|nr:conserved hypothetical protein [Leishmania infantum JPCM5]CAC9496609.1 hypothetical_protein_-_conserved [Leishmania infantum]CAM68834.1 conserved hypothetical protein [Leishmania infantum JPCM5]SUZ42708.1 hypothetical_protein_-_conserved [Leishmania infantum]|eukprot:XP_001470458.1 conserved hypothetical protein [Leishmania infantum JPCM5]
MSAKYPPESKSPHNSSGEEEEEEEEEDEDDEEEIEEWTEVTPLSELAELEDGPSSHFVGGFSVCNHLGDAIDRVQFKEDIVLVFPGVYAAASSSSPSSSSPLELNEAQLGGLRVYSVSYAREHSSHGGSKRAAEPRYMSPSKRRVGPWFTYLTAAAAAVFLAQGSSGGGTKYAKSSKAHNPLEAAALKAVEAIDSRKAASTTTMHTTSGSSVFAPAITATTANPQLYPVFDFPISIAYTKEPVDAAASSTCGLPHYMQQAQDSDEDEEDEEANETGGGDDSGAEQEQEEPGAGALREEVAITLAGLCARAGVTIGALTRTHITHCVIGSPQQHPTSSEASTVAPRIAITAAPLSEALVDHCLVYGGSAYGLYAYPRCALAMRSCIVEGPNTEAATYNAASASAASAASAGGSCGGSALAQLQRCQARTQLLRRYMDRFEEGQAHDTGASGRGGESRDIEEGVLPRFCVPGASAAGAAAIPMPCEVAIMCDDADVQLTDCLITHTRHGVLLHGGCAGTVVKSLSVRSIAEVGLYVYGMAGAADVQYSSVLACGLACLLVVGPSAAQVAAAEAELPARPSEEDEEEGTEQSEDGQDRRRPIFSQHPHIRSNCFIGAVRVQGEVRSGAMVDNLVFLPRDEQGVAAAAAAGAQTVLSVPADTERSFAYVGMEGERVPARAADEAAAA